MRLWDGKAAAIAIGLLAVGCSISTWGQTASTAPPDSSAQEILNPGVVVEEVEEGWGADQSGIRKGDILLTWSRGDAGGKLESPFDMDWLDTEQRPRGTVILQGLRGAEHHSWKMVEEFWGMKASPNFRAAVSLIDEVSVAAVLPLTDDPAVKSRFPWLRSWLLARRAELLAKAKRSSDANDAHQQAVEAAKSDHPLRAYLLMRWGDRVSREFDVIGGERLFLQANDEPTHDGAEALARATVLRRLGELEYYRGNIASSRDYFRRCLDIYKRIVPDSYDVAWTFVDGANALLALGDWSDAENHLRHAERMARDFAPKFKFWWLFFSAQSSLAFYEGNFAKAEYFDRRALQCAATEFSRAWAINNLGSIAWYRGDLKSAQHFYHRALEILQQIDSTSLGTADSLENLGMVTRELGDLPKAEEYLNRALRINQEANHGEWYIAANLDSLGVLAERRGDMGAAEHKYIEALQLYEKISPNGSQVAWVLQDLGHLALANGENQKAKQYYGRACLIIEAMAPKNGRLAEILSPLGEIARREGRLDSAEQYYRRALDALEGQAGQLGGSQDARAGFRGKHAGYYSDYAHLLIGQGKVEAALGVLERSHARTLLETLAAAQVNLRKGADPTLLDRERNLQAGLHAKSERRIRLLGQKESDNQVKEVEKEIDGLLVELQDVESQLRVGSPGYAALTQPQPLTAREIQQQLLDSDTLLLEYSLGEDGSTVIAVTPTSLTAFELPRRAEIEKAARRVYDLLTARNHPVKGETEAEKQRRWAKAEADYPLAAAELSRMILGPVAPLLGWATQEQRGAPIQSKRVLIVADGILHYIPFAMLPQPNSPTSSSGNMAPLIVTHEVVNLPSASVLAVLRQEEKGRKPAPKGVAVLADPVFDQHDSRLSAALKARSAAVHADLHASTVRRSEPRPAAENQSATVLADPAEDGLDMQDSPLSADLLTRSAGDLDLSRDGRLLLPRLVFSRREAEAIRNVTPPGQLKEAVDFQASRAAATSPDLRDYRIVHFATHGLLNSEHPELSGLVLSLVDEHGQPQDGFLQLQDIYNLDLPVDLVVLSACETGLGKEISGEGLIGLTRGFMYAGASRVVASLWSVSDVATARLMADFYRAMEKDHLPPAAALRAAQIRMWKQKRWSSPYYWAAFQIQGEWK